MFLIMFSACSQTKIFAHKNKKTKLGNSKIHLSYLKMHRSGCFGRCPTYSIEVFENGLVRFTGIRFIADTGIFEKNFTSTKVQELLTSFEKYRVDTLKPAYENRIVDLPGIEYLFTINNKQTHVNNAHFGPSYLRTLARNVDDFVLIEGTIRMDNSWKKVSKGSKEE